MSGKVPPGPAGHTSGRGGQAASGAPWGNARTVQPAVWGPARHLCLHQGPLPEEPRSSLTHQPCPPMRVTPTLQPLLTQHICLLRTSLGSEGGPPPETGLLNLETPETNTCSPGWTSALLCPDSLARGVEVSYVPHLTEGGSFKLRADPGPWFSEGFRRGCGPACACPSTPGPREAPEPR